MIDDAIGRIVLAGGLELARQAPSLFRALFGVESEEDLLTRAREAGIALPQLVGPGERWDDEDADQDARIRHEGDPPP